jgi:hypothetical protein
MLLAKIHAIRNFEGGSRAFTPQKVLLDRVDQDKMPVFDVLRQSLKSNCSKVADTNDPDLFHNDESIT